MIIPTDSSKPTHHLQYATGWLTDYMHRNEEGEYDYTPETVKAVIKNLHADLPDAKAAVMNDESLTQVLFEIGRMKPEDEKPIWIHSSDRGFWIGDGTNLNLKIIWMQKGSVDWKHWPRALDACEDDSQTLLARFEEE